MQHILPYYDDNMELGGGGGNTSSVINTGERFTVMMYDHIFSIYTPTSSSTYYQYQY